MLTLTTYHRVDVPCEAVAVECAGADAEHEWLNHVKYYLGRPSMAFLEVLAYHPEIDWENVTEADFLAYRDWKIDHDPSVATIFDTYEAHLATRTCSSHILQYYFDQVEACLLQDFQEFVRWKRAKKN
jgi:hypothetical protein